MYVLTIASILSFVNTIVANMRNPSHRMVDERGFRGDER
jgi:hypothetical protein